MKKAKKILTSIFCALITFCFAICGSGCLQLFFFGGDSSQHEDLLGKLENGEIDQDEFDREMAKLNPLPLYGTKVLYRPQNYDYDESVGEGNNEYYGQYAWRILSVLKNFYGIVDINTYMDSDEEEKPDIQYEFSDNTNYYYDSIRYSITSQTEYGTKITYKLDENSDSQDIDNATFNKDTEQNNVLEFGVNYNNGWIWKFPDKEKSQTQSYLNLSYDNKENKDSEIVFTFEEKAINEFFDNETGQPNHYHNTIRNAYTSTYLGGADQTDFDNYSTYVKVLEYAIYCISLDLTPAAVSVDIDTPETKKVNGVDVPTGLPTIKIGGKEVDTALAEIKALFKKIGSYVGFTPRRQDKLTDYIMKNVIGDKAKDSDTVTYFKYDTVEYYLDTDGKTVLKTVYKDAEGNPIERPEPTSITIGRHYAENVNAIVKNVSTEVSIGTNTGDKPPTIDNAFAASEIRDYSLNSFVLTANDPFAYIKPMEYQSAVLMFNDNVKLENLELHFKYDANGDGKDQNSGKSLDIKVYINQYDSKNDIYSTLASKSITVIDGEFNFGSENHWLDFYGLGGTKGITVGKFDTEVGSGWLHDKPEAPYDPIHNSFERTNPVKLVGTTSTKDYYKLVEPEAPLPNNKTYSYGILNQEKFKGVCDYLEIVFEVQKTIGDEDTNYQFYVCLGVCDAVVVENK